MAPSRGRLALLLLAAAAERPCCSEDDYALGEWVRDETATWAFRTGPDTRSSHCEAARRAFAATGAVPDYLRWRWAPAACDGAPPLEPAALCAQLDGRAIGVSGDSTMEHFVHSLVGLMTGSVSRTTLSEATEDQLKYRDWPPIEYELCGAAPGNRSLRLLWHRLDFYPISPKGKWPEKLDALLERADYLVLNWGAHYLSDR